MMCRHARGKGSLFKTQQPESRRHSRSHGIRQPSVRLADGQAKLRSSTHDPPVEFLDLGTPACAHVHAHRRVVLSVVACTRMHEAQELVGRRRTTLSHRGGEQRQLVAHSSRGGDALGSGEYYAILDVPYSGEGIENCIRGELQPEPPLRLLARLHDGSSERSAASDERELLGDRLPTRQASQPSTAQASVVDVAARS